MAGFIQLIEYETNDIEAVEKSLLKFREEHPGVMTYTASRITEDRDKPGTYISIVEFESYEAAMKQSNNPDLSAYIQKVGPELMTTRGFRNLNIKTTF